MAMIMKARGAKPYAVTIGRRDDICDSMAIVDGRDFLEN